MDPCPKIRTFSWGGARPGAGRKRGPNPKALHRARPKLRENTPVHVTLSSRLTSLRTPAVLGPLRVALCGANRRDPRRFRVVHFALRDDRVELIVEAKDERCLSEGLRSVAIRIARAVNVALGRTGSLWADRWRGHPLESRRAVRAALASVLTGARAACSAASPGIDPYSSGEWFDGWHGWTPESGTTPPFAEPPPDAAHGSLPPASGIGRCARSCSTGGNQLAPVAAPRTALLRTGWRGLGLLDLGERPAGGDPTLTSSAEASSPP